MDMTLLKTISGSHLMSNSFKCEALKRSFDKIPDSNRTNQKPVHAFKARVPKSAFYFLNDSEKRAYKLCDVSSRQKTGRVEILKVHLEKGRLL